jgi:hypothetical protein
MKNKENAFPICEASNMHPVFDKENNLIGHTVVNLHKDGMSLRDYFAAKALNQIIKLNPNTPIEKIAELTYKVADAMIAERDK